ncbi:hypothetical protein [Streptomyces sp. NPDC059828]|uniref:hypothetical protein n=1 Tax=Streptomyces sp. NPDC059828 TaxID=3346965 RepID=UPI00364C3984
MARLPVTGIEYVDTLNGAGTASVGMPLHAPEADPSTLLPGASGLAILRDDTPVWGGILWGATADLSAGTLALSASGYHSYYAHRYLDSTKGYSRKNADQSTLLKDWISYANANGGIGTDTSAIATRGRTATREWSFSEFKKISEAIEELADDLDGFNFRYEPYWVTTGTRIGNRFRVVKRGAEAYPQLEHRVSCNVTGVTYDGTQLATQAYAFGADLGTWMKPFATSSNPALTTPRMVTVATYSDLKASGQLIPKAAALATVGSQPIAVPTLTLYPQQFSPVQFQPGAVGTAIADSGYVALMEQYVITERRVGVDVNGTETVSLALASKEVFDNGNSG